MRYVLRRLSAAVSLCALVFLAHFAIAAKFRGNSRVSPGLQYCEKH